MSFVSFCHLEYSRSYNFFFLVRKRPIQRTKTCDHSSGSWQIRQQAVSTLVIRVLPIFFLGLAGNHLQMLQKKYSIWCGGQILAETTSGRCSRFSIQITLKNNPKLGYIFSTTYYCLEKSGKIYWRFSMMNHYEFFQIFRSNYDGNIKSVVKSSFPNVFKMGEFHRISPCYVFFFI